MLGRRDPTGRSRLHQLGRELFPSIPRYPGDLLLFTLNTKQKSPQAKQKHLSRDFETEDNLNSSTTSLQKFAHGPKIRVSKIFLNEIKEVFELFDKNGLGRLEVRHLKVVFRALGFDPTPDDITRLLAQIDKRGAKFLSECEFREIMAAKLNDRNSKSEISRAFKLFDDDNTGKISFENLKRVSEELGENLEDEELREMIEEADLDGDGEINEQEFARVMKKANLI